MQTAIESTIRQATGARALGAAETVQKLWSGYGSIMRYPLIGSPRSSVIVKHVAPPEARSHPRGWNTDVSHQRKLQSYRVETAWYRSYARRCGDGCRVPQCLWAEAAGDEWVLALEDLDAAGFDLRKTRVGQAELRACLDWLAHFHATFLGVAPEGLWPSGTYWHLETRPDELKVLAGDDPALAAAAEAIDARLKACRCQTLVHGDAKLANFCFRADGDSVAAVDFQYVGGGCGMKDVAYFIGSCLDEEACASSETALLDLYFECLREALERRSSPVDPDALEAEWRPLYAVAWTDFHRFLKGWSPGHWKIHGYSEALAREVVASVREEGACN